MASDRPLADYKPYKIVFRKKDLWEKWGTWRPHSSHTTPIEQRDEFYRLTSTEYIQYDMREDLAEKKLLDRAMALRDKPAKLDDTDIAGAFIIPDIPPEMDVITYADQVIDYLGKVSFQRCQEDKTRGIL